MCAKLRAVILSYLPVFKPLRSVFFCCFAWGILHIHRRNQSRLYKVWRGPLRSFEFRQLAVGFFSFLCSVLQFFCRLLPRPAIFLSVKPEAHHEGSPDHVRRLVRCLRGLQVQKAHGVREFSSSQLSGLIFKYQCPLGLSSRSYERPMAPMNT